MTVSNDPDADTAKKRGNHKPITFTLSRDREASRENLVDVSKAIKEAREFEADEDVINVISHLSTKVTASRLTSLRIARPLRSAQDKRNAVLGLFAA